MKPKFYGKVQVIIFRFIIIAALSYSAQASNHHVKPGYPRVESEAETQKKFNCPPSGYGESPFFWWSGVKLNREHLTEQLDQLQKAGVYGLVVSYHHAHPDVDKELPRGGGFGSVVPSDPPAFSEEWWELWNWFSGECARRGMTVGLDDYVFQSPGNGFWTDEVADLPAMKSYQGSLEIDCSGSINGGQHFIKDVNKEMVGAWAYPKEKEHWHFSGKVNLLKHVKDGRIDWCCPKGQDYGIAVMTVQQGAMLHPEHGEQLVSHYFQRFEDRLDADARKGMNCFFQDELHLPLEVYSQKTHTLKTQIVWAEDFQSQFKKRKGYDILPELPALLRSIGSRTHKVRLDYYDVALSLAEERYFKPLYNWHNSRGLLYGCDNWGRGLEPLRYIDYFRAIRWFSAPGNDAPREGTALIQTKVSSSVSHLYQRPRTWLEAFHSIGWNARPDMLTQQFDRHYVLGANLFCLHGLYYTLNGGYWEWAPPCFHFRMPYWPHMEHWLKYTERLSYILSQGTHVCDVAIVYPVSSMQAAGTGTDAAFKMASSLHRLGIDFDFIDWQSLERAEVKDGSLNVAGESYRVLVIPDMPTLYYSTMAKANELFSDGGMVLSLVSLPSASNRIGSNDPAIDNFVKRIFGQSVPARQATSKRISRKKGLGLFINKTEGIQNSVDTAVTSIKDYLNILDFTSSSGQGFAMHRKVGKRDLYFVVDVPQQDLCFFRSSGKASLWDPWTGTTSPLAIVRQNHDGTWLRKPTADTRSAMIVFSEGDPLIADDSTQLKKETTMTIDGLWKTELTPTLNNKWGDFRIPAFDDYIGVEARELFAVSEDNAPADWQTVKIDPKYWQTVHCSFGPGYEWIYRPENVNTDVFIKQVLDDNSTLDWKPYEISWRWGIYGDPGPQGYHGLKGRISNDFLVMKQPGHYAFRTGVIIEETTPVRVSVSGYSPSSVWIDGEEVDVNKSIQLKTGLHHLVAIYENISSSLIKRDRFVDLSPRSAVVLLKENIKPASTEPLAMKWFNDPRRLVCDPLGQKPSVSCYRFKSAPGLDSLTFNVYGKTQVWVNGHKQMVKAIKTNENGSTQCVVSLSQAAGEPADVALRVENRVGYRGGAAFPSPIKIKCSKGKIALGDWSDVGVMKFYSGGMWYRKEMVLSDNDCNGSVKLDLGEVIATCEIWINGQKAGILVGAPWMLDISQFIKPGSNSIEVLVYNTLSNHYQSIPSKYKGDPASGLMGPVKILISQ